MSGSCKMALETQLKADLLKSALASIDALRAEGAIVHCITNTVAQNFTANVLLACGATPSMTVAPEEVASFSARADAVLINLGTLDEARNEAINLSIDVCTKSEKPFVLDPVMCHVSPSRLAVAMEVLGRGPAIIRANTQEADALRSHKNSDILPKTTFALTGSVDIVRSVGHEIKIENGTHLLSKVTAIGCAQGGLMAALLPKSNSPMIAAIASLIWVGVAGENASALSNGPGSFQAQFVDQLYSVETAELKHKARIS